MEFPQEKEKRELTNWNGFPVRLIRPTGIVAEGFDHQFQIHQGISNTLAVVQRF